MKTRNVVLGVAAAIVVLLLVGLVAAVALWGRNAYGMMGGFGLPWGMHNLGGMHTFGGWRPWGGMHTLGGGLLMLIFWAVILGGGAWLLARTSRQGSGRIEQATTPLEIARLRYARGEIDRDEFEQIRQTLLG